ncbi:MAG: phycobilisome linker polypeptide [Cyanobacteria bacterium P01_D01_bin.14]
MVGMMTTGSAAVSDYNGRAVVIDVTGVARQSVSKTSNYQVKVPYSQIKATLRNLTQMGGQITKVTVVGADSSEGAAAEPAEAEA